MNTFERLHELVNTYPLDTLKKNDVHQLINKAEKEEARRLNEFLSGEAEEFETVDSLPEGETDEYPDMNPEEEEEEDEG